MKTLKKALLAITFITASLGTLTLSSCATGSTTNDQAKIKQYPLKTCIVTDSKLGSMGDPITKVYNGQEVKFCCAPCIKKFEANPEKYLTKIK